MSSQVIWLVVIALAGIVFGACVCAVFWVVGAGAVAALTAGGTTFIGVATLGVAAMAVLSSG